MRLLVAIAGLAVGCVRVSESDVQMHDAEGISGLLVRSDRGSFDYTAGSERVFTTEITSWATGTKEERARRNLEGNAWSVVRSEASLIVETSTTYARAGVDVWVDGPSMLNLDVQLSRGQASVQDVLGTHFLQAGSLYAERLEGEGTFVATSGSADLELWPYEDALIEIDVEGSVVLRLPAFGPYDLQVFADEDTSMSIADLGFDELVLGPGWVEGWRFPGTTLITVVVRGSSFELIESF